MSSTSKQNQEGNYFIGDHENVTEMARLLRQDSMLTEGMGGLLAEREQEISAIHTLLDLACGPGGWVMQWAANDPHCQAWGIDISTLMIAYAQQSAQAAGLSNAHFLEMDVSQPLDFFAEQSFDLINVRYLIGFLPAARWPTLFTECKRLLRPGGTFRLTDMEVGASSTSLALERLTMWLLEALWKAGQSFAPDGLTGKLGITAVTPSLFRHAGYEYQGSMTHLIDFSSGTRYHQGFCDDCRVLFQLTQPFLLEAGVTTEAAFEQAYEHMLLDMDRPDFRACRDFHTFWGKKPGGEETPL